MIDLDRFEPVNDRHGHHVGDRVLREVARRMDQLLRRGGRGRVRCCNASLDNVPALVDAIGVLARG